MLVLITGKLHVKSDAGEIVGQSWPAHPSGRWPASRDTTGQFQQFAAGRGRSAQSVVSAAKISAFGVA
jgi:hypothetical protein